MPHCSVPGTHFCGIVGFWCVFVHFFRLVVVTAQTRAGGDTVPGAGKLFLLRSFLASSGQDARSTDMSKIL